ncbi:MAG: hypothetical protein LWY06_02920 [Firmicutes bacterium]|nr:hypothetical protein [Bacillota bacterium]
MKSIDTACENHQNGSMLSSKFDFSDGANNSVEIALMPSVDMLLGQIIAESVEMGCKIMVEGSVIDTSTGKQVCRIEYETIPDINKAEQVTRGAFYSDKEKNEGTFIYEKLCLNSPASGLYVKGNMSTHTGIDSRERLVIAYSASSINMDGVINDFHVTGKIRYEKSGAIVHTGTISDIEFERMLVQDEESEIAHITGKVGNLTEKGEAVMQPDGSILLDRNIGQFHVIQKVYIVCVPDE